MAQSPEDVSAAMHARDDVARLLGIEIGEVAADRATASMTVTEPMTNGLDVCHGGLLFTLADTAMAYASNSDDARSFSTTASIEWLNPAHIGDHLTASCAAVARRGRNTVYDVEVRRDGDGVVIALLRGQTLTVGGSVVKNF
ncbi:MAG: hotdog fold thioesterase [Actinobacteria bacterium]|jgi:acyl-CoA thioesterase|nr:hotdog fold thioesterase [Actinomycetota bacterium]